MCSSLVGVTVNWNVVQAPVPVNESLVEPGFPVPPLLPVVLKETFRIPAMLDVEIVTVDVLTKLIVFDVIDPAPFVWQISNFLLDQMNH